MIYKGLKRSGLGAGGLNGQRNPMALMACRGVLAQKRLADRLRCATRSLGRGLVEDKGQGTTEYAILVGVLVVIAIAAVLLFRGRLESLWSEIADGINSL